MSARSVAEVAAATPATRDRWADALRVGSLLVVVLGHWLMVALTPEGELTNALVAVPALQPVTWLLQVMPLFFLVGGVAHAHSLDALERTAGHDAPGRYAAFVTARAQRLLRPSLAFLAVWLVLGAAAHLSGLTRGEQGRTAIAALVVVPQLLWFVGIYLGVAALAPVLYRWHRRAGWAAVLGLAVAAVVVDVVRFRLDAGVIGNLNFAFVWIALHQCGFLWRDGLLVGARAGALVVAGAVGLGVAFALGPYPVSMVGLPGQEISNMAPPTAALLAQGFTVVGLAALAREPMARLLHRPRVWRTVVGAGGVAMTAFLWHLSGLLVALLVVRAVRVSVPDIGSAAWWATRPVWVLVLAVPTALLVAAFLRFDRGPRGARGIPAGMPRRTDPLAALAVAVVVLGVLMVSMVGVDVLGNRPVFFLVGDVVPGVAFAVLALGLLLLRAVPAAVKPTGVREESSPAT